jgi:hypothetical protein
MNMDDDAEFAAFLEKTQTERDVVVETMLDDLETRFGQMWPLVLGEVIADAIAVLQVSAMHEQVFGNGFMLANLELEGRNIPRRIVPEGLLTTRQMQLIKKRRE